jgi:hypothetical protein
MAYYEFYSPQMQKQLPSHSLSPKVTDVSSFLDKLALAIESNNPVVGYALECAARGEKMDPQALSDLAKKVQSPENLPKTGGMGMF